MPKPDTHALPHWDRPVADIAPLRDMINEHTATGSHSALHLARAAIDFGYALIPTTASMSAHTPQPLDNYPRKNLTTGEIDNRFTFSPEDGITSVTLAIRAGRLAVTSALLGGLNYPEQRQARRPPTLDKTIFGSYGWRNELGEDGMSTHIRPQAAYAIGDEGHTGSIDIVNLQGKPVWQSTVHPQFYLSSVTLETITTIPVTPIDLPPFRRDPFA